MNDIMMAVLTGDLATVTALLDAPEGAPLADETLLHAAIDEGHQEIVALLVARGAPLEGRNRADLTPLMRACMRGRRDAIAHRLVLAGADVNAYRASDALTVLDAAVGMGAVDVAVLTALLDAGALVDGPSGAPTTPLYHAVRANHLAAVELLVARGARIDLPIADAAGRSVVEIAEAERRPAWQLLRRR